MTTLQAMRRIVAREVALESAGREVVTVVPPFVLAAVLLAGLSFGPGREVIAAVAPGLPWLVVLFAAAPLSRGVAAVERDEGCWDLLRAIVNPSVLLAGKLAALWLWLAVTWGLAILLVTTTSGTRLAATALPAGLLGTLGLAGVTVVFGVVLATTERRGGIVSVLLLPAGVPPLLAGTQAATLEVDPFPWLALLAAYDVVVLAVAWAVFPVLLEE